jgi:preprotein translocase subunit SecE
MYIVLQGNTKSKTKVKQMTAEKIDNKPQQNDLKQYLLTYFKGVKAEWGKVSWPTRQQVITETGIVLVVVSFFTVVVYIMDLIFKFLLGLIK